MEANIGIGIYGEEGLSAAQASDFAIGEFKLLKNLLIYIE
jgi:phospholipid-transporting ATPase